MEFSLLRRHFALVNLLLSRDDFIFDKSSGSVIATAKLGTNVACPIYKQLSLIFDKDSMTNRKHVTVFPCYAHLEETKTEWSSEYDDAAVVVCPPPKRRRIGRGVEAAIANAIFEMAAASKLRTSALNQLKRRFFLSEYIRELDQTRGVAENVYFAALEFFNSPNARETFLSLKSDMCLPWLQWKCNAASHNAQS